MGICHKGLLTNQAHTWHLAAVTLFIWKLPQPFFSWSFICRRTQVICPVAYPSLLTGQAASPVSTNVFLVPCSPCKFVSLEMGLLGVLRASTPTLCLVLSAPVPAALSLSRSRIAEHQVRALFSAFKLIPGFRGRQSHSSITNLPMSLSPDGLSDCWRTFLRYIIWDGKNGDILIRSFSLYFFYLELFY